ncbi:hypothetical protein PoB_002576500 [Plakobranchus ocellatus]|uniref:Uncharacterized protein n=1 Tax=Plakobranchus ocellatus TaxID=259542 RepID=A0AAV3ZTW0_9GAST|nr:hypothetical protein PoB_002576500 [Plakobranchus ocellatus]
MIRNKTTKAHRGDEKSSLTELTDITGAAVAMPHKSQSALTPASYKHPSWRARENAWLCITLKCRLIVSFYPRNVF